MLVHTDILIVGAGPGGAALAAALAAADAKADVLVAEQASYLGGIQRGDLLHPAQLRLFEQWGVLPLLLGAGAVPVRQADVWHHRHGHMLTFPYADRAGAVPTALGLTQPRITTALGLTQPRITAALLERASASPRMTIWQGATFIGLETAESAGRRTRAAAAGKSTSTAMRGSAGTAAPPATRAADGVTATLQLAGGSQVTVRSRWLIAADGRYSLVRQLAGLPAPASGRSVLLAAEAEVPGPWAGRHRLWLHPAGFVAMYPLSSHGPTARIVASVSRGRTQAVTADPRGTLQQLLRTRAPGLEHVQLRPEPPQVLPALSFHAPAYAAGRIVLLGDAAHAFPPTLGLGMNAAIADAAALAELLADAIDIDPAALQQQYEARRHTANAVLRQASEDIVRLGRLGPRQTLIEQLENILALAHGKTDPVLTLPV